ncbi:MAG: glycoside hydrolase family 43 protein [Planctomycetota bacterium]
MKLDQIQIRDPFILPMREHGAYYLFGTTDKNCWGRGTGFDCYRSEDLETWDGPFPAFRPPDGFWATHNFWAPEAHAYRDRFYLFATFKADRRYRGTQVLVSDEVAGPYTPLTDGPVTPPDWQCLDGTLYVDGDGTPWIVFCHEWIQVHNGSIWAMPLTADLTRPAGRPAFLFNATEAPWVKPCKDWPSEGDSHRLPAYVTDGPFLHRLADGSLIMLWSSTGTKGYAMGYAKSQTGQITGPWTQIEQPLWSEDGGHGMIFRTFDDRLMLTFHSPNQTPHERPFFTEIEEANGGIRLRA